jgi:hypothetical protein
MNLVTVCVNQTLGTFRKQSYSDLLRLEGKWKRGRVEGGTVEDGRSWRKPEEVEKGRNPGIGILE